MLFFIIPPIICAILMGLMGWTDISDGNPITVGNILLSIAVSLCPFVNLIVSVCALVWLLNWISDYVVFEAKVKK